MRKFKLVPGLVAVLIAVFIPMWLALTGVWLVTSEAFLAVEYNRSDFPADRFGFTREDRLRYAPLAVEYLRSDKGIGFLAGLKFPDGSPMYNDRELRHMEDVRVVMRLVLYLYLVVSFVLVGGGVFLYLTTRNYLRLAIQRGALVALGVISFLLAKAALSWDYFFTGFHRIFFADGTWRFEYSDTLIRLFPEKFWFDAAVAIGSITVIGSVSLLILTRLWARTEFPDRTDGSS